MGSRCVRLRAALRAPGLRCAGLFQAMRWGGETEHKRQTVRQRGEPRVRSPVVDEGVQVVEAAEQRVGHPAALRGAGAAAVEVSK